MVGEESVARWVRVGGGAAVVCGAVEVMLDGGGRWRGERLKGMGEREKENCNGRLRISEDERGNEWSS